MRLASDDSADDDPRVLQAARAYLAELEAGRKPDRQAYVGRHPELAQAVAECLDGIDLAQTLRPTAPLPQTEYPANPLGDFQIRHELGRGGMGVVYEAVQLSLGRRVALKVLPFAAGLDAKHLQRFKTEAHAAAQLHHTNIVPVYAVGCERGVHFYAMQLIDGQSLDAVLRGLRGNDVGQRGLVGGVATVEQHADHTAKGTIASLSGRGRESCRTAAQIAAQVADALEYAHEAGVVHRDIKPANLLLDAKGNVWVTDFGLAHITANVSLTQTGDLVGTLRYMSPEQASGRRVLLDHRTDVYSLGATLYELLAREPIFSGQDRQTLLHQILHEEPRSPRQTDRSIPVELETIVLKALAKSPTDRYATAGEMRADLHRFLDERPILARRPSLVEHARKWLRRHPSLVGAAVLLLVFGIVGLAATTALIGREQARTQAAYDREIQRAEEAEQQFRLARRAADEMIRMAEEELADQPHLDSLRKRMLEAALAYYQEFIEQRGENPDAQVDLAATRDRVKKILDDLAVLQGAGQLSLLTEPAVLDDLKLTQEQRGRLAHLSDRLAEQRHQSFQGFHRLAEDERRQRFLELARTNEAAVAEILSPEKLGRLRQIALQRQGLLAFREPNVVAALKLTPEQRERIRAIEADTFFRAPDGFRPGPQVGPPLGKPPPPGNPPPHRNPPPQGNPPMGPPLGPPLGKGREQAMRSAMDRIQTVLMEEQAKRWQELTGEPFKAAFTPPPPDPQGPAGPDRPGPHGPPRPHGRR